MKKTDFFITCRGDDVNPYKWLKLSGYVSHFFNGTNDIEVAIHRRFTGTNAAGLPRTGCGWQATEVTTGLAFGVYGSTKKEVEGKITSDVINRVADALSRDMNVKLAELLTAYAGKEA